MKHYQSSFLLIIISIFILASLAYAQEKQYEGAFAYMTSYSENAWHVTPKAPFKVSAFTGETTKGIIILGGNENKQAAFLKDLGKGKWSILANAPFSIIRCAGNNMTGPIITGGSPPRSVAYIRKYTTNVWLEIEKAPFNIIDIAGDNNFGPLIAGGENQRKVAFLRNYTTNKWQVVNEAPFKINVIAGTNEKGPIIAGGEQNRKVAIMRNYNQNEWEVLAEAPFAINDIAGTNQKGVIIIGGRDNMQVAYMSNYTENRWHILKETPIPASQVTGTNETGIIVGGGKSRYLASARQVTKKIYKTAVVEFTERGDLGIQDAGTIVAEWMTTALNKTGAFEVYERLSLNTLMEEHKLGSTGLVDDETIAEIGRIRGVQAIITGSVIKFGDVCSVTAKVVDVTTAKIIKSADIKVTDVNDISNEIEKLAWELAKE